MIGELAATAGTYTALSGLMVCLGAIGALSVWRMGEPGTTAALA